MANSSNLQETVFSMMLDEIASAHQFVINAHVCLTLIEKAHYSHILLPQIIPFALQSKNFPGGEARESFENMANMAEKDTEFVNKEVENNFQFSRLMHHVALWSAVETCLEGLLCVLYENKEDAVDLIRESGYRKAKKVEKNIRAVGQIKNWEGSLQNQPILLKRQGYMLRILGLDVEFEDNTSYCIQKISEFRNCIVHNKGLIDEKTLRRCPWLDNGKYYPGKKIVVEREDVVETHQACGAVIHQLTSALTKSNLIYPRD